MFVFDNSYSWMRSKELYYSVTVLPPGSEPTDEFSTALATDSGPFNINPSTDDTETGLHTGNLDSATSPKLTTESP